MCDDTPNVSIYTIHGSVMGKIMFRKPGILVVSPTFVQTGGCFFGSSPRPCARWRKRVPSSCGKISSNNHMCLGPLRVPILQLTGWWFGTWLLFSPIVGMMIQSDFHIFQRGRYTTNQLKKTLRFLSKTLHFTGFRHCKIVIPSTSY